jgi:hypothetical protein
LALAVLASFTRPFTLGADVVTAVALAAVAGWGVLREEQGRRASRASKEPARGEGPVGAPWGRRWLVWVGVGAAVGGFELFCYLSAPRAQHPTLSALVDILDATRPGKIVAFAAWLALGGYLVTR